MTIAFDLMVSARSNSYIQERQRTCYSATRI